MSRHLIPTKGISSLASSLTRPPHTARPFSTTAPCLSQIGRTPLSIPPEVTFRVTEASTSANSFRKQNVARTLAEIQGPLGKIEMELPDFIRIDHDVAARKASVRVLDAEERQQRAMWGTTRAYLHNHILGVSEGHTTILRLVGVGYRAVIQDAAITKSPEFEGQKFVVLKVGYSHPIELPVPAGITASTPQPTRILLQGTVKETLNEFAAKIRAWRVPEPYKGKGIFVNDETIQMKNKKIK